MDALTPQSSTSALRYRLPDLALTDAHRTTAEVWPARRSVAWLRTSAQSYRSAHDFSRQVTTFSLVGRKDGRSVKVPYFAPQWVMLLKARR